MRHTAVLRQISRSTPLAAPVRSTSSSLLHRLPSSSFRLASKPGNSAWSASGLQARRWYADSTTENESVKKEGAEEKGELSEADKAKAELEAKNKEIVELKDKYLRSVADFRNLQERAKRDQASARDFAITKFAKDLVESVDNLDRAFATVPMDKLDSNADLKNLFDGLKMTETILMGTLAKHGLVRFDPSEGDGEKFDPNKHEAAFMTKIDGKEDGMVFSTMQKGFTLNGRIIRAAKVGVVKNS